MADTRSARGYIRQLMGQHRSFTLGVSELDKVFGRVVGTFLRFPHGTDIQKRFAQLTIGEYQPFLIADNAMPTKGLGEVSGGFIPLCSACLFHFEVMVQVLRYVLETPTFLQNRVSQPMADEKSLGFLATIWQRHRYLCREIFVESHHATGGVRSARRKR